MSSFPSTLAQVLNSNTALTFEKVEGEAQGEEDGVQKLLKDIDKGPTHSHIVKLEKAEIEVVEGESGFEVRA